MKWTRLAIPLSVLLMIAVGAPSAWAQGTKKATGTISAVTGNSVTVKASSGDMTFSVDKDTTITTPGGGTKEKAAKAQGKSGVPSTDVLKVGQAVEVSYHDMGDAARRVDSHHRQGAGGQAGGGTGGRVQDSARHGEGRIGVLADDHEPGEGHDLRGRRNHARGRRGSRHRDQVDRRQGADH